MWSGVGFALLNLGSSDVSYALNSNFPFYTEQTDGRAGGASLKPIESENGTASAGGKPSAGNRDIKVGVTKGRLYPLKAERPGYIAPPSEPLRRQWSCSSS